MKKFLIFFTTIFFITTAAGASQLKKVKNFTNDFGQEIIEISNNSQISKKEKNAKIIELIEGLVDTNWISRFVLGKHYRRIKKAQKADFKNLYREFMIKTYSPKFSGYQGGSFEVSKVIKQENFYLAKCLFGTKDNEPKVKIDFRIRPNKKYGSKNNEPEFYIFDVVAEGISLIETQRSEFRSAISKNGFDKFYKNLEEKVENLNTKSE